jgi:TonB family protein
MMEAIGLYLLKSVTWLSGFALIFILFLRNERFFNLNRIYLLAGLIVSFIFPVITIRYAVYLPAPASVEAGAVIPDGFHVVERSLFTNVWFLSFLIYITGALAFLLIKFRQSRSVIKTIRKAAVTEINPVKLIRSSEYSFSFSFFSYVFINPSVTDAETNEIMKHEKVHISQKHWIDLMLAEVLCIMQWFNPLAWIYVRFIRQNHEYLADEAALQGSSDPDVYKATLLNQIIGYPVVSLSNPFNYSLNKKRFLMMKNIITSPYRKMRILMIVPVIALILYAFATPEIRYSINGDNSGNSGNKAGQQAKELNGKVLKENGSPLQGATVILQGTTTGTLTDAKGTFRLTNVPDGAPLIVSYVGFKSKVVKPVYTGSMTIPMVRDTINVERGLPDVPPPPPPPPPRPSVMIRSQLGEATPLYLVDGVEKGQSFPESVTPDDIHSMSVLKGEEAIKKYGEKGKNGVVEIITKKSVGDASGTQKADKNKEVVVTGYAMKPDGGSAKSVSGVKGGGALYAEKQPVNVVEGKYLVVERLPEFPGGKEALMNWIKQNMKYPEAAVKSGIQGNVMISFVVDSKGKVVDVKVDKPVNPILDAEAVRLISSMPDWKPGMQAGSAVDCALKMPVNFVLR